MSRGQLIVEGLLAGAVAGAACIVVGNLIPLATLLLGLLIGGCRR